MAVGSRLRQVFFVSVLATVYGRRCQTYGSYAGSEDSTLWRSGFALKSSGLERPAQYPPSNQTGAILGVELSTASAVPAPRLHRLSIRGIPHDLDFRPHGLHLDNTTQRLYAVCHAAAQHEESVVVFDIVPDLAASERCGVQIPALRFRYALTSPAWTYFNVSFIYFLNDIAAVDGHNELYTTQFGPMRDFTLRKLPADKFLWRCTWDESQVRADGRLVADCDKARGAPASRGYNGIAIDPASSRLWVNDLWSSRLLVFDRSATDGSLRCATDVGSNGSISLPGVVDNVERDHDSGDFTMGWFKDAWNMSNGVGGVIEARALGGPTSGRHATPRQLWQQDTGRVYQVSTSLTYGRWTILGSCWDAGLIICDNDSHNE